MPRVYPPYQHEFLEPGTRRVSKPWHLFFLSLAGGPDVTGSIPDGGLTLEQLPELDPPTLLGRGSAGTGPVEVITLGPGLEMDGTELSVTAEGIEQVGYWTPITNGDPVHPEILFDAEGDCVVGFVPTS